MIITQILRFLFLISVMVSIVKLAHAGGIDGVREKALRYKELSLRYEAAAFKLSKDGDLLSGFRNVDEKEQFCMVLLDLLGVDPGYSVEFVHPDPGLSSQDAKELFLHSLSLKSYVIAANALLVESDFSWRYKWNLNCSGVFGSYKYIKISESPRYSVSVSGDGTSLIMVGDVEEGLFDTIAKRLAIRHTIRQVELASSGGLTYEALKIGRLLRKRGITTVVGSNCLSSCALIFLGGVERIVPPPYWDLGFHRASEQGIPVWDGDGVYEKVRIYIDEMIGGGEELVKRSLMPTGLDFYRPGRKDLCWRKIATSVVGFCKTGSESEIDPIRAKQDFD